jgi:hypothetical protein
MMNCSWLIGLLLVPLSTYQTDDTAKGDRRKAVAQIEEAVFRTVVRKYCQQMLCLLAVNGKALEEERLRALEDIGRVAAPSEEDIELDASGMSGAARSRGAQVIDITKVIVERHGQAIAHVSIYATVIDATLCQFRLQEGDGQWVVYEKGTRCAR